MYHKTTGYYSHIYFWDVIDAVWEHPQPCATIHDTRSLHSIGPMDWFFQVFEWKSIPSIVRHVLRRTWYNMWCYEAWLCCTRERWNLYFTSTHWFEWDTSPRQCHLMICHQRYFVWVVWYTHTHFLLMFVRLAMVSFYNIFPSNDIYILIRVLNKTFICWWCIYHDFSRG